MRLFVFVVFLLYCGCGMVNGLPAVPSDNQPHTRDAWVFVDGYNSEDDVSGTNLLKNVLDHVDKGHVTQESVMHWMKQIQDAMNRGSLSADSVRTFLAALKEKLADTPAGDNCCVFG